MQKKLIVFDGLGAMHHIRLGQARAFQSIGYNVILYNQENPEISVLDLFNKVSPDVVLLGSYQIDRPTLKALKLNPNLHIILFAPNWGDLDSIIDKEVLQATPLEISYVEELKKWNTNLQYCFTYYGEEWLNQTHNNWNSIGLIPQNSLLGADIQEFPIGKFTESLSSEIFFCGGYWAYKSSNLDKYLIPLCNEYNVKIFGAGYYPTSNHIGFLDNKNVSNGIVSAKICPSIYEPLARFGFDISERIYKIMSSGGFAISMPHPGLKSVFPDDEFIIAEDETNYLDNIKYYIRYPEKRLDYVERSIRSVYTKHTYFHRIRDLVKTLGFFDDAAKFDQIVSQIDSQIPEILKVGMEQATKCSESNTCIATQLSLA